MERKMHPWSRKMRVLVVGSGICAVTAAVGMRRLGHEVTIMNPRRPGKRDYIIELFGPGFDVAERIGLLPALHCVSQSPGHLVSVDVTGKIRTRQSYERWRWDLFKGRHLYLRRNDFAKLLFRLGGSGLRLQFGVSPVAIDSIGATVKVKTDLGSHEFYDLMVGADGARSHVRQLAFLARETTYDYLGWHVAACVGHQVTTGFIEGCIAAISSRDVTAVVHPLPERKSGILLIHRSPVRMGERSVVGFREEIETTWRGRGPLLDRVLDSLPEDDRIHFDNLAVTETTHWSQGRVVLLGDAAASLSLLSREGASLGILGAYVLAQEIEREPEDIAVALARYEARVRPVVTARQQATTGIASWFVPPSWLGTIRLERMAHTLLPAPLGRRLGRPLVSQPIPLD